ncbi:putative fungal zn binuclear cluster domain containing protein [Diaporthe ampelina]|uniref:Putative fungal zn binuclear cluster domain containing protein n=1 Tax=Diaporthe ampelina TaxID=1214573 RepID=A0A0G2FVZ4_9PEZI|nr:putative fungal zn binuclear cluster domain containing protein [Diaporthe ampelina]
MFEQSQIEFDFGLNNFAMLPDTGFGLEDAQSQSLVHFNIPSSMQTGVDASPPWTHIPMQQEFSTPVVPDSFDSHSGSSIGHFTPPSGSGSSIDLSPKASPGSLQFKLEGSRPAPSRAMPIPTAERKDRTTSKVRKTQKRKSSTPPFLSASRAAAAAAAAAAAGAAHGGGGTQGSAGSTPENPVFLFCNATPDTWAKGGGGFDGPPDASKASQKGRKGALSNDTRANALAVRQKGACFCCHVRKVKCDQQRPCRSCERFCAQVPQAVCWQFDDFTRALFPPFMRAHFARDEMARFVADNVASFTLDGVEQPDVTVVLSSGAGLRSKLSVKAKFFTPRAPTSDVMQHWFHTVGRSGGGGGGGDDRVELEALRSAPLGLDSEGSGVSFRAELKRKVEKYVDDMVQEPGWPQQVTASMARKTDLPRRALQAVQRYAQQSGSGIVRRALGVYTMQYMLSHHLTMTPQCVESLRHVNPVAASGPWMTPRLLNRQVKAVVDDLVLEGVAALFDEFGKLLKRRGRAEWAPCTAAFVVFCLLMESIQASADVFVISEIEIEMRNRRPAVFRRAEALDANRAIESMPFKQFAFQFHQIYQSHVRDGSARPFNPLVDDSHDQDRDLDSAALELVMGLRSMVHLGYGELDWLTLAPMAPAGESHPYPRNVEEDYIGRLMAKFLLSFLDSRFISGD